MKALTLTQPWASLVAIGAKRIETRSWKTHFRGPLAIHAAMRFPVAARDFAGTQIARTALSSYVGDLPLGVVLATCRLITCYPTRLLWPGCLIGADEVHRAHDFQITLQEWAFGNFNPGRWAWFLADVKPLPEPVPAKGAQGLWNWTAPETRNA